jgi:hypothetical protein
MRAAWIENIEKSNLDLLAALLLLGPVIPALLLEILPVEAGLTERIFLFQQMQIIILFVDHDFQD